VNFESTEEARWVTNAIGEDFGMLEAILTTGMERLNSQHSQHKGIYERSWVSQTLNQCIRRVALERCRSSRKLRHHNEGNINLFIYGTDFTLKFKQIDENGKPRNNHTKTSLGFYSQKLLLDETKLNLVVGYRPDEFFNGYSEMSLIKFEEGVSTSWAIDINREAMANQRQVDLFVDPNVTGVTEIEGRRARFSRRKAKEEKQGGNSQS
jgi:hypothetical protein